MDKGPAGRLRPLRGLVVAGTHSGCGKTTLALGLLAACARRGLVVQPFKAGPDFIDPGLHALAAGRTSHNLDAWMLPAEAVRGIFARHARGADLALVEGVMGLYDGASGGSESGSTAEIAKLLSLPVLLAADARSMARSAAALVQGFVRFDPALSFAGVVFNRTGGQNHEELLFEAMRACPEVRFLGCLPRREGLALPSRHLGLVTAEDLAAGRDFFERLADFTEAHLDLDHLLGYLPVLEVSPPDDQPGAPKTVRIGVARDRAFSFCYAENLRLLESAGAELAFFSPVADSRLPEDVDGLYLPGGYPELSAEALSNNASLRRDVLGFSRSGRPVLAECGGLIYLADTLVNGFGRHWRMSGVFPARVVMDKGLAALGYREVRLARDCLLGPAGTMARGHEFHYSRFEPAPPDAATAFLVSDRKGPRPGPEGFLSGETLGTYIHLHFGSNPALAGNFARRCLEFRPG